ncbi:MAG: alkaline phosphatase family protein [Clostridia bacterium]|nr:alkaline phosphatase family protein [Clostridia bacterium]
MEKVILISIDGMRPDGLLQCGNPFVEKMMKKASYSLDAQTVSPSVTLPCHMSMFHSVTPQRHGITTNIYIPLARPLNGLFEQLKLMGKVNAMFYGWEQIRDVSRPDSLRFAEFYHARMADRTDTTLTDSALRCIENNKPDFVFLYLAETDEKGGHDYGWMTPQYLDCINVAIDNVKKVYEAVGDEYTIIVTADHGGHDRSHGTEMPEDMTIPVFFFGKRFEEGKVLDDVSILDITPTITDVMDVPPAREWEGKSVCNK